MPRKPEVPEPLKAIASWWKIILFIAASMGTLAMGVAAWDVLRPWVIPAELATVAVQSRELHKAQEAQLQLLAARSCETEIKLILSERRGIQRDLIQAEANKNGRAIQILREQLQAVNEALKKANRRCGFG